MLVLVEVGMMQRVKGERMETIIKKADITDAKYIAEIEKQCFSTPWSQKDIIDSLNSGALFLKAETQGEISGYCGLLNASGEGYIINVGVSNKFRRQKIASKLIEELIKKGREMKLDFISLEVRESNIAAQNLYKKFGFQYVGKRPRFYSNPIEDAFLLTVYFNEE